jgi:cell division septation protein DedD
MARIQLRRGAPRKGKKAANPNASGPDLKARLTQLRTLLRRRWQMTVVLGALLTGSLYFFGLRPANAELERRIAESDVAESRASKNKVQFEALQSPEGAAEASAKFDRALEMDTLLPATITPLAMLQTITTIATDAGLELGASTPAEAPAAGPAEGLQFYTFAIVVEGDFTQIMRFVEGLQSAQPMVSVYSAKFTYTPASPESGVAALVRFESEVRFWTSNLEQLSTIKADLDAKRREDQGLPPLETTPPTTLPSTPPTLPSTPSTAPPVPGAPADGTTGSTLVPTTPVSPSSTLPASPSTSAPSGTSPSTSTPASTLPASVGEVTPGAFCSPEGALGTYGGVPHVCSKTAKNGSAFIDGKAHWRPS